MLEGKPSHRPELQRPLNCRMEETPMNISNNTRIVGITAGIAIFVAVALLSTIAATKQPFEKPHISTINAALTAPAEQLGMAYAAVAAHIKPAVVSVYSEKMVKFQSTESPFIFPFNDDLFGQFFNQPAPHKFHGKPREFKVPQNGMGSGMILDKEGRILTNYHVVSDVDNIKVQLADKRSFEAKIIGSDPKSDVAIIQITGKVPDNLQVVQLGDSDAMEDGYLVLAVGAPFGLAQTVTNGIISAKGRSDVGIAAFEDFLQTDAPINPGNSGGPLVNMRGEVIGMNSAIATGGTPFGGEGQFAGVGFSIPSNMIKAMLPTLSKGEKINRGMLGIVIQDINPELAAQFHLNNTKGALITQVNKASPAEKAGLKSGDVIVRFEDKEVKDTKQLRNFVAATAPGNNVRLTVIRDGKEKIISSTIGKMSGAEKESLAKPKTKAGSHLSELGVSVQTLTPELAQQYDLHDEEGVVITEVNPGSPASVANLKNGDLIVEVNRMPVTDVKELRDALSASPDQVLMLVKRNDSSLFVVIRFR
jgi:serine protease Do